MELTALTLDRTLVKNASSTHFLIVFAWIVCCHIAFFQIENDYFREALFYLAPWLSDLLPKAATRTKAIPMLQNLRLKKSEK